MVGKRKNDDEKSKNKNTQQVTKRRNNMSEVEHTTPRGQIQLLFHMPCEISGQLLSSRTSTAKLKNHATVVQQRLGIGEGGGAYSLWDDGNIAWETEDEDDEVVQEAMWREDEKANGVDDVGIQKIQREMVAQSVATTKKVDQLGFSLWRRKWRVAYQSTLRLMKKVNTDPDFLEKLPPAIDPTTGIYYNKVPPHLYFSKMEMAVWRNFTSWNLDGDIAYLPGPAEWYPDDYDTTQHGFHVDLDAGRAYEAWEMLAEETEPTNFKWVLPSDDTLVLLPPTKESEEFLSQFYEM
ncbi:hypothetical protein VC83_04469 [Pseudogymnoascus destructans]|uniref:Uncharacterized protein n=1 Tax=Pseudogymnoascus destructans TaxID=655981 RepID=A0A177ABE7_9PEZI|nr:uncharacterized protein VC83_04469 [Pseudogymnoascus destructans]OAF59060.1 hypothetical protein VC83_04469 [Pseudogymnoascus destructans]